MIDAMLMLTTTLATTVPTFFMRLKPTSSIAKPACMNITRQPVTITQTVSAATPAAWVAVGSSAATAMGMSAPRSAKPAAIMSTGLRFLSAILRSELGIDKYFTSKLFAIDWPQAMCAAVQPETCVGDEDRAVGSCSPHDREAPVDISCRVIHT